ncbi:DUF411 domain-containing protein [Azospirillum isscasi]|uniref:DUF411 domain-containing protein n=1 Tax=Azospirillum isscasi TaxID=3053926 RepID=A0ABU0WEZ4_9PROT|nr:DUF411 domain-containing protein [Azospirillum isscasi]MDQ2102778.1 DUF411 domain-containing protein [Azospirillum isscasi]
MRKRKFISVAIIGMLLGGGLLAAPPLLGSAPASAQEVEVWKARACDCCEGWVKHMRSAGFTAKIHTVDNLDPIKAANGVPDGLVSCHTAVLDGYVVEGHVPATDLHRLLAERPQAKGLAAPGMPPSAPGMDMPGQPYEVIAFGASGGLAVYAHH